LVGQTRVTLYCDGLLLIVNSTN